MKIRKSLFITFLIFSGIGLFIFTKDEPEKKITTFQKEVIQTFKPKGKLRDNMIPFYGVITDRKGNIINLKNKDGSTAALIITDSTEVEGGRITSLKKEVSISGIGKLNEDESVSVSNIKINPKSFLKSDSMEIDK